MRQRKSNGTPVPAADRAWLAALVEEVGLEEAARRVRLSRLTVAASLAGLPTHYGTHAAIAAARAEAADRAA